MIRRAAHDLRHRRAQRLRQQIASFARDTSGATLVELLVVLAIVSILAVTAIPFAENAVQRRHEQDLRLTLRQVRTAIDAFHRDWQDGTMDPESDAASANGYPVTLDALVEGVDRAEDGPPLRYLRALPQNPFAGGESAGWLLMGYADAPDTRAWNGEDIYDLRAVTDRVALDGTDISDW